MAIAYAPPPRWPAATTALGGRVAVEIVVEEVGEARLRAYTDTDTTAKLGDAPVWLGWDSASLSILRQ